MSDICGACWHDREMHVDKRCTQMLLNGDGVVQCPCKKYVEE